MKYKTAKSRHKNTFIIILLIFGIMFLGCSISKNLLQRNARVSFDISPDGKQIVFSTNGGDLFLLDLETKKVEQITDTAEFESDPKFSPDGEKILFNVPNAADVSATYISRIDLATKKIEQLTSLENSSHQTPVYSQDGKRIAFLCSKVKRQRFLYAVWVDWAICVMDSDGKNLKVVSDKKGGFHSPIFIKEDTLILFTSSWFREDVDKEMESEEFENENSNTENIDFDKFKDKLYTVASDGSSPISEFEVVSKSGENIFNKTLTEMKDYKVFPDFSDLDNILIYNSVVINLDSMNAYQLPGDIENVKGYPINFHLSKKTKKIYFLSDIRDESSSVSDLELWSVDLNGKNAKKFADKTLFSDPMSWSPK